MSASSTSRSSYQTLTTTAGLRVVYRHTDTPVSYCGFMFDCGTRNESGPAQYGMAHFIEHILFKGTKKRDSWHINNRMESVGGELNAFTTKEETTFYSVFLDRDYERAIELLCDLVGHPTAPEKELIKELKKYPGDSPVCFCRDWESCDENGYLDQLDVLKDVCDQRVMIDDGLDWSEEYQIILNF